MNTLPEILDSFLIQAQSDNLKYGEYPREWGDFTMKVSFGQGAPARVPWIAYTAPEMKVSHGFYPVYLYYKTKNILILAYGISETEEFLKSWPPEVMAATDTIRAYFDEDVPRYGDSYVFKAYNVVVGDESVNYTNADTGETVSPTDLEADLSSILSYYREVVSMPAVQAVAEAASSGLFYMEKQLEDFIIHNWANTEFGKKYDLIYENGEMVSQQYRTGIGPIDILAKDKVSGSYVVIELKKNQTSDDTMGQLARYMGWIKENKNDPGVKGVIIAGQRDKKLDYALDMLPNAEGFVYEVSFKLHDFTRH